MRMEYERLLSPKKTYGAANEDSTVSLRQSEDGYSHCSYPLSDPLISSQEHFTKEEINKQVRKAKILAEVTLIVTSVFVIMSLISSEDSDSSAAFGFAFDSMLAALTSSIILWRFWSVKELEQRNRRRELVALFIICISLFITGILVGYRAIKALVCTEKHKKSTMLLVLSSVSVVIYLILFALKYRVAKRLHSRALRTDSIDALCGAILALSIVVTSSTREFTAKVWFLDSVIALGVALFSLSYGVYSFVHLIRLRKEYREFLAKGKETTVPEILYQQV